MNARARHIIDLAALPARSVPRLALREQEAADAIGVSLSVFLDLVREGKMPKPIRIRPRLPVYDIEDVRQALQALKDAQAEGDTGNDFDR